MCGINGIFGIEHLPDAKDRVLEMNRALAHRGPDAEGVYSGNNAVLAHKRLSIIDPHPEADQPFSDQSGRYYLVFNGEIYNFQSIKKKLPDYNFLTKSDTEVLLAAFITWGPACLQEFNGMFAFAIWDELKSELFIARDRLGIKPLYYLRTVNEFVFSSEIRSILASGLADRKIDADSLVDYLRYQTVHAPKTIVKDVYCLMPGHYLIVSDNELKVEKYWDISHSAVRGLGNVPYDEVINSVSNHLKNAVKKRLVADVPFGAFLSGGIDSSAIVAMMSANSDMTIKTFNVSFDEEEFSEAKYAKMVADKFSTQHTEIKLTAADFLKSVPDALAAMDHPSGDGPNTYVVSQATKDAGVTMALSGLGGDELFAGYGIFKQTFSLQDKKWLLSFPKFMRRFGASVMESSKPGISSAKIKEVISQDYFDTEYVYQFSRQLTLDKTVSSLLNRNSLPSNAVFELVSSGVAFGKEGFNLPLLSKVSYAELVTYLPNVLLRDTDQMSMAHALEVRVPFLDHELLGFVMGIPDKYKYPKSPKKLLTDSLKGLLPEEIINRPKMGFTFPWEIWLKNELRDFCEERIQSLAKRPYFNNKAVLKRWSDFLENKPGVTWARIWYLVVLEDWLNRNGIE